jgi:hypothetical protein
MKTNRPSKRWLTPFLAALTLGSLMLTGKAFADGLIFDPPVVDGQINPDILDLRAELNIRTFRPFIQNNQNDPHRKWVLVRNMGRLGSPVCTLKVYRYYSSIGFVYLSSAQVDAIAAGESRWVAVWSPINFDLPGNFRLVIDSEDVVTEYNEMNNWFHF